MADVVDFDAPLQGTAEDREDAKRRALDIRVESTKALGAALNGSISADAWGYKQLCDIADERQRAMVSDQIRSAARGISWS